MCSAAEQGLKEQGNEEFKKGNHLKAAAIYSKAIKEDGKNAVLYSNRCAALLKLNKVSKAHADAEECIRQRPEWDKGYFRKAAVLEAMGKPAEALEAYQQAAERNPGSREVSDKVKALGKQLKPTSTGFNFGSGAKGSASAQDTDSAESAPEQAVRRWAQEIMDWLLADAAKNGLAAVSPSASMYPVKQAADGTEKLTRIGIGEAFASPDMLQQCTDFLRTTAAEQKFTAVCVIVPKSKVAYPQVWRQPGWPHGRTDGVFVQLDSPVAKGCWFLPHTGGVLRKPEVLSDKFKLLEPLIR